MDWLLTYITENLNSIGAIASIAGVIISVVGFFFAISNTRQSKQASIAAKDAAVEATTKLGAINLLATMDKAKEEMVEIKRLQREGLWLALPMRYTSLRAYIIAIKAHSPMLTDAELKMLQATILTATQLETLVEQAIQTNSPPDNIAKMNRQASQRLDQLTIVLETLRHRVGRQQDD